MTIQEVQQATAALAQQITQLIQAFEASTGCIVHSIPVRNDRKPVTADVKVQIP